MGCSPWVHGVVHDWEHTHIHSNMIICYITNSICNYIYILLYMECTDYIIIVYTMLIICNIIM